MIEYLKGPTFPHFRSIIFILYCLPPQPLPTISHNHSHATMSQRAITLYELFFSDFKLRLTNPDNMTTDDKDFAENIRMQLWSVFPVSSLHCISISASPLIVLEPLLPEQQAEPSRPVVPADLYLAYNPPPKPSQDEEIWSNLNPKYKNACPNNILGRLLWIGMLQQVAHLQLCD